MGKHRGRLTAVGKALLWVLIIVAALFGFSLRWMLTTWGELTFEEVLYQLTASLEGTGSGMILQYVLNSVVPTAVVLVVILLCRFVFLKNSDKKRFIMPVSAVLCVGLFLVMFVITCRNLGVVPYIRGQLFPGTFIADNYVNPDHVNIEFPEKKRNLIYIFMESGETTFADKENGGAFDQNVIPELTALAQENEDFSGADNAINGGVALYDTTWTMAAIFGQTSGLPLKTSLGRNGMVTMESFFPNIVTMGDVLEDNGYKQVFMLGSPVVFGGRATYFMDHGNFEMQDYYYMQDQGKIPKDYYVFWGFEDAKLFDFAKEEATELAKGDEPFNLTLLTVDTHFEDGYVCEDCGNEFDDQYSNVYACSSKKISEFVKWVQQQDFYEDTSIVIVGDHPTMDLNYCNDVDSSYQRKVYTTFINSAVEPERNDRREYSTFDMFPTAIASLGATIPGDRLGLGTNLFSSEETLLEKYGKNSFNTYLQEKSVFLDELMDTGEKDFVKFQRTYDAVIDVSKTDKENELRVEIKKILGLAEGIESMDLYISSGNDDEAKKYTMDFDGFTTYSTIIDTSELDGNYGHLKAVANGSFGGATAILDMETDIYLLSETYLSFLHKVKEYLDEGKDITVLCASQSASSTAFKEYDQKAMNELGFETDFSALEMQSFYGVIENGTVTEKVNRNYLTYRGSFKDGLGYKINSGGYFAGRVSHIIVDGVDYTRNRNGFNYFIYDNEKGRILSSDGYVTQLKDTDVDLKMVSYDEESMKLTVEVSKIIGVRKWDRKDDTSIKFFDPADQSTLNFEKMTLNTDTKIYTATLDLSNFKSDRIQFQINSKGDTGKVRVSESLSSLEYLQYYDVAQYFDYLKNKDNIAVILADKTSGLEGLDDAAKNGLKALGLSEPENFAGAAECGYAAVVSNGQAEVEMLQESPASEGINDISGKLADGTEYVITSSGLHAGDSCKIVINGTDYSLNRYGLNIVVYDYGRGEVVDTAVLNANGDYIISR